MKMPVSGKKFFSCEVGLLIEGSEDGEKEKVLSKWSVCFETSSNLKLPKMANLGQKGQVGPTIRQKF